MPTITWPYVDEIDYVGAPIDYEAMQEIRDNVDLVNASVGVCGTGFFTPGGGTEIVFSAQADTDYIVIVVASSDTGGNLGDVWVRNDTTTTATVFHSGSTTAAFRFKVMA